MAGSGQGVVTALGVRDGDPGALAALANVRGASVLAFCAQLCEPATAAVATADAFARFRAAVYAAPRLDAVEPDALLLQRTRQAAAEHAAPAPAISGLRERVTRRRTSSSCARVPVLLAARASGELSAADQERLSRHLSRCASCRVLETRFRQAERAYRQARPGTAPPAIAALIVEALASAAPVSPEFAARNSDAGPAAAATTAAAGAATLAFVPPDDPQPDYGEAPTDLPPAPPPVAPAPPAYDETEAPVESYDTSDYEPVDQLDDRRYGDHELTTTFAAREERGSKSEPGTIAFPTDAAKRARGALLRPGALRRRPTRPDRAPRSPRRGGFAARIVAPAAIVVGGLGAALAVAGVFNAKTHNARHAVTTVAPAPPPAAIAQQPTTTPVLKHHHRRHHARHAHHKTTKPSAPVVASTPTRAPTTTTPPKQVAVAPPAPAPKHTTTPTKPPTAHVIGGPTSQAPPQTGAPAGTGPSGYQPSAP